MPKLLVKFETAVIKDVKIDKSPFSIGRKPDNDLVLDHPTVSGHHCKIYSAGNSYFVEDLNSTNGTFVNSKKIIKAGLRNGDIMGIVKYFLIFNDSAADAPAPAPAAAPAEKAAPQPQTTSANPPKAAEPELPKQKQRISGGLEVLEGVVDKNEYDLTMLSTYIGKSSQANIPMKGAGIFNSGPDLAVVITMRPEGYYLVPIKEGCAKHNGNALIEKVQLKDDDIIEVGASKFRFFIKS